METLETLANRIDTTEDIQSIVRTMKSLSAVSIRQYERAVEALRDFEETIALGLKVVLGRGARPVGAGGAASGRTAAIVIGSDRGLCGRFNEGLVEFACADLAKTSQDSGRDILLLAVGARAAARLETFDRPAHETLLLPGSVAGLVDTAQSILIQLDRWRESAEATRVVLYFNRRTADARARPVARTLVPISETYLDRLVNRPWPSRRLPTFTMDADALFSHLVRQRLFISVYRAGAESLASEHASRLAAMQAAERNIDERLEELSARFRHQRQESITTELMDIVAGFNALR